MKHLRINRTRASLARFGALLVLLAPLQIAAQGKVTDAYPPISVPVQAKRLDNTNAYYILGKSGVPGPANEGMTSNGGFVVTEDGVVVFDALGTPSLGAAMIEEIRKVTDKPIRYVIVSHYHADHIYGLQAFRDHTEAKIIAHKLAYQYINSADAGGRLAQRQEALAPWINEQTRLIAPDQTFDDKLTLELGGNRMTLLYVGPAHGPDDVIMVAEPAGVLYAGDIVQTGRVPFLNTPDANTERWLENLETVKKMAPKYIVPGHGQVSNKAVADLDFTIRYINFVREQMKQAVENWVPFEEAYEQIDWSEYRDLPAFQESNKGNAYRVYLEVENSL